MQMHKIQSCCISINKCVYFGRGVNLLENEVAKVLVDLFLLALDTLCDKHTMARSTTMPYFGKYSRCTFFLYILTIFMTSKYGGLSVM